MCGLAAPTRLPTGAGALDDDYRDGNDENPKADQLGALQRIDLRWRRVKEVEPHWRTLPNHAHVHESIELPLHFGWQRLTWNRGFGGPRVDRAHDLVKPTSLENRKIVQYVAHGGPLVPIRVTEDQQQKKQSHKQTR